MLSNQKIKELINNQPRIHFEIKDDEGFFGKNFPKGVDELYFEAYGEIKDVNVLKSLFELFLTALDILVEIDSAYETNPDLSLL